MCGNNCEEELYSTVYDDIASVYRQKNQVEKALEFYEKTLNIEFNILPANHPSIAITLNSIGLLYLQMDDYPKTLEKFLKCLPIILPTLPNNHPELAVIYMNIGLVYKEQNEISKSIEHLLEAEQIIDRSTLTFNHNLRENLYHLLMTVSRGNNMIDLSIRMHHRTMDVLKAQIPSDQYKIAVCARSLGDILFDHSNHEQSFEYHRLALDVIQPLPCEEKNKSLYNDILSSLLCTKHVDIATEHYNRLLDEETNKQSIFAGKL